MIQANVTGFTLRVLYNTAEGRWWMTKRTNKMFWSVYWSLCGRGGGDMKQGIGLTDWQNVTVSGGPIRRSTGRWKQDRNKPTTKMSGADILRDGGRGESVSWRNSIITLFLGAGKEGRCTKEAALLGFTVFNLTASPWRGQICHISDPLLWHSYLIAVELVLRVGYGLKGLRFEASQEQEVFSSSWSSHRLQPHIQWVTRFFSGAGGQERHVDNSVHQVPSLGMGGVTLLLPLYAFIAWQLYLYLIAVAQSLWEGNSNSVKTFRDFHAM
jgi:hypothetical protein